MYIGQTHTLPHGKLEIEIHPQDASFIFIPDKKHTLEKGALLAVAQKMEPEYRDCLKFSSPSANELYITQETPFPDDMSGGFDDVMLAVEQRLKNSLSAGKSQQYLASEPVPGDSAVKKITSRRTPPSGKMGR